MICDFIHLALKSRVLRQILKRMICDFINLAFKLRVFLIRYLRGMIYDLRPSSMCFIKGEGFNERKNTGRNSLIRS